jgi:hypothetical protein
MLMLPLFKTIIIMTQRMVSTANLKLNGLQVLVNKPLYSKLHSLNRKQFLKLKSISEQSIKAFKFKVMLKVMVKIMLIFGK